MLNLNALYIFLFLNKSKINKLNFVIYVIIKGFIIKNLIY